MKTLLVAINAQYFHTALAVRSIAAWCRANSEPCEYCEYTINQHFDELLRGLAESAADVYIFSCYIWNIELVCSLAAELHKLFPHAKILAGGPQVSYHSDEFLAANPAFGAVLCGEGEETVRLVLQALQQGKDITRLPGVATGGHPATLAPAVALDEIPFPYDDLRDLPGRILYYESMRGCPYRCSYCLSAAQNGVRLKSLNKVFQELGLLLAAKPKQVKFVDRTFNCKAQHALAVWRFLAENDNGTTNFHFELAAELLTDEMLDFLATVRPGLFQFEIGVQSCNTDTLQAIDRPCDLTRLFATVQRLQATQNIHLHLDLIAGLPHEDYTSFGESFTRVYNARPQQLQLGFLKVLPGSPLEQDAKAQGLVYTSKAPFEILYNSWLNFAELSRLKDIAAMVELYYNSGRFSYTVAELLRGHAGPFAFYEALALYFRAKGHFNAPLSKLSQYEVLAPFAHGEGQQITEHLQWLCRFDIALHEKPRKIPTWVRVDGSIPIRDRVLYFYDSEANRQRYLPLYTTYEPKQLLKMAHVELFPFNPRTGEDTPCALLFDYSRRDITGKAHVEQISL